MSDMQVDQLRAAIKAGATPDADRLQRAHGEIVTAYLQFRDNPAMQAQANSLRVVLDQLSWAYGIEVSRG